MIAANLHIALPLSDRGSKKAAMEISPSRPSCLRRSLSNYSVIVKMKPSERPKTSGKYCSRAVAGITWKVPGMFGCK